MFSGSENTDMLYERDDQPVWGDDDRLADSNQKHGDQLDKQRRVPS